MLAGFAELEVSQQERSRESKAQPHTAPACALSWGWSGRLCSVHVGRWALQGSDTHTACPPVGSAAPAPRKHTEGKGSPALRAVPPCCWRAPALTAGSAWLGQHYKQHGWQALLCFPCQLVAVPFLLSSWLGSNLPLSYICDLRNLLGEATELRLVQSECGVTPGQQMPSRAVRLRALRPQGRSAPRALSSVPLCPGAASSECAKNTHSKHQRVHGYSFLQCRD